MTIASKPSTPTIGGAELVGPERSARFRRIVALSALGLAAVTVAACGSSSAASSTSSTASPSNSGTGNGTGSGTGTGGTQRPGAFGTIAAINGASLEVQNPNTGQTTVTYTPSTTFDQSVPASASSGDGRVVHLRRWKADLLLVHHHPRLRRAGDGHLGDHLTADFR